jgi:hypothetical protein
MFRPIKIGEFVGITLLIAIVFLVALSAPDKFSYFNSNLFIPVAMAQSSPEVTATVDRNVLGPEDTLTLKISISSGGEVGIGQPTLRGVADFEVLNEWTSQEARAAFVNTPSGSQFKTVRSTHFHYMLQPQRVGDLVIGAAEVVVGGKAYLTQPIRIRVEKGAGGGVQPRGLGQGQLPNAFPPGFLDEEEEDLFTQLLRRGAPPAASGSRTLPINPNEAFFIQVEADKSEAYVGEQITVSWYLYTRGQIKDLDTLKYPSLKGFWKEDIEIATHLNFSQEVVNGLPYKKALLASFALFPIKEGTAIIDEYKAKCTVVPSLDTFTSGAFGRGFSFTKSSQPLKVTVKPLPNEGRPADFSGAVGDFEVSARVEDRSVVANQPFTFKIRFEGKGNAKMIDIPPFQPPETMELYDTQKEAKFFRSGTSYKDFGLLLIPRREGEFLIPPISVSVFNPQTRRYVSKVTESVRVFVGQGVGLPSGGQGISMDAAGRDSQSRSYAPELQNQVRNNRSLFPGQQVASAFLFMSAVTCAVLSLVGLILLWRARVELGWGEKRKDLMRQLRLRLRRTDAHIAKGDWRSVGVEMTNIVYYVLGEISGEGGANVELEKLMLKAPPSVRRELAEPLAKQMEIFQILSFAPEGVVGDLKSPSRLKEVVADMTKLMEKAVALGASSGQSSESELDPKSS